MQLSPYNKAIASLASGLLAWGGSVAVSAPSQVTSGEWVQLGGVFVATLLVYLAENKPKGV